MYILHMVSAPDVLTGVIEVLEIPFLFHFYHFEKRLAHRLPRELSLLGQPLGTWLLQSGTQGELGLAMAGGPDFALETLLCLNDFLPHSSWSWAHCPSFILSLLCLLTVWPSGRSEHGPILFRSCRFLYNKRATVEYAVSQPTGQLELLVCLKQTGLEMSTLNQPPPPPRLNKTSHISWNTHMNMWFGGRFHWNWQSAYPLTLS